MTERRMPPTITPLDVAKAFRVTKKRARGWMRSAGILEKDARGNYFAHESAMHEKRPDMYQRVYSHLVFGEAAR